MAIVIFLRGVNVGGHRTFRPSELVNQLKNCGLVNIGAAGTFVACKPVSEKRLRAELHRRLPFETEVMMCTGEELIAAAAENRFEKETSSREIVRFVSVLAKLPEIQPAVPMQIPEEGKWLLRILAIHGRFVFGCYRREMKAIGYLGKLDKLFDAPATTRNWNTIGAILKVLEKASAG